VERQGIVWASIRTDLGGFRAGYSAQGLAALQFPNGIDTVPDQRLSPNQADWHDATTEAVRAALSSGRLPHLPPFDLGEATEFQKSVWAALQRIERGSTRTYQDVAQAIGRAFATRAVGQACGRNPIPLLIPCHRVLAAGGRLGGFSGGLEMKRVLLRREGVSFLD